MVFWLVIVINIDKLFDSCVLIFCFILLVYCEREKDEGCENDFEEVKMCYGNVKGWY